MSAVITPKNVLDELTLHPFECWVSVASGARPPIELPVILWDDSRGQLRVGCLDCASDCWYSPIDGRTFAEGAMTHWKYCNEPTGVGDEGAASMSSDPSEPATKEACPEITRDSMRILGEQAGKDALKDLEGCFDPAAAFEGWRDHCYAKLAEKYAGHVDLPDLLTVWSRARDSVQPLGLTPKESALLEAYRLSDERGRQSIDDYAVSMAEDWPRYTFAFASDQVDQSCVPDVGVSSGVDAVLAAFNGMDERRQKESLHFLEALAREFPA
jgi:hypothetical protein